MFGCAFFLGWSTSEVSNPMMDSHGNNCIFSYIPEWLIFDGFSWDGKYTSPMDPMGIVEDVFFCGVLG